MDTAHRPGGRPDRAPNPSELEDMLLDAEGLALALRFLLAEETGDLAFPARVLSALIIERIEAAQGAVSVTKNAMETR